MQTLFLWLSIFLTVGFTYTIANEDPQQLKIPSETTHINRYNELFKALGNGACAVMYFNAFFYTFKLFLDSLEGAKKDSNNLKHTFNQSTYIISIIASLELANTQWQTFCINLKKFIDGYAYAH